MKLNRKILALCIAALVSSMTLNAFAGKYYKDSDITTYNLVNDASFPIHYGYANVHDSSGDAQDRDGRPDAQSWASVSINTGDSPAAKNQGGVLPPGDSVSLKATANFEVDTDSGHSPEWHGGKYSIDYSYPGGYGYLFYDGWSDGACSYLGIYYGQASDPGGHSGSLPKPAICISNKYTGGTIQCSGKGGDRTESETITFYNPGHKC